MNLKAHGGIILQLDVTTFKMILCSVPCLEICPSDAISLSRDISFIQVKQHKISWDKFLQIPANFEVISQQI
jgi:formate hydrogenlyase subunit 6/NADH:ubiquinone oxidoreductase subunit I